MNPDNQLVPSRDIATSNTPSSIGMAKEGISHWMEVLDKNRALVAMKELGVFDGSGGFPDRSNLHKKVCDFVNPEPVNVTDVPPEEGTEDGSTLVMLTSSRYVKPA